MGPEELRASALGGSARKDKVESCLARAVCAGKITLDEARRRIWSDGERSELTAMGGG